MHGNAFGKKRLINTFRFVSMINIISFVKRTLQKQLLRFNLFSYLFYLKLGNTMMACPVKMDTLKHWMKMKDRSAI